MWIKLYYSKHSKELTAVFWPIIWSNNFWFPMVTKHLLQCSDDCCNLKLCHFNVPWEITHNQEVSLSSQKKRSVPTIFQGLSCTGVTSRGWRWDVLWCYQTSQISTVLFSCTDIPGHQNDRRALGLHFKVCWEFLALCWTGSQFCVFVAVLLLQWGSSFLGHMLLVYVGEHISLATLF